MQETVRPTPWLKHDFFQTQDCLTPYHIPVRPRLDVVERVAEWMTANTRERAWLVFKSPRMSTQDDYFAAFSCNPLFMLGLHGVLSVLHFMPLIGQCSMANEFPALTNASR